MNATVKFHLSQYLGQKKLKCATEKFLQNLYVDHSTTSFDDVDEGSFDLRKWITNNENLQHRINEHEINYKPTNDYHKVLGLNWDYENDEFIFEFSKIVLEANKLVPTKRSVLKITGMFFDPLGLRLPIIIPSKFIFQKACVAKFSWDSLLSTECRELWDKFLYELNSLESVSIKRHILCNCGNRVTEIHGFCDSSAQAYCAVVYVRVLCSHGVGVNLWAGKRRVAPMKDLSIPRLELLACVLLSKLVVSVINAVRLEVQVRNVFCWMDSQIAVWWIK